MLQALERNFKHRLKTTSQSLGSYEVLLPVFGNCSLPYILRWIVFLKNISLNMNSFANDVMRQFSLVSTLFLEIYHASLSCHRPFWMTLLFQAHRARNIILRKNAIQLFVEVCFATLTLFPLSFKVLTFYRILYLALLVVCENVDFYRTKETGTTQISISCHQLRCFIFSEASYEYPQ